MTSCAANACRRWWEAADACGVAALLQSTTPAETIETATATIAATTLAGVGRAIVRFMGVQSRHEPSLNDMNAPDAGVKFVFVSIVSARPPARRSAPIAA